MRIRLAISGVVVLLLVLLAWLAPPSVMPWLELTVKPPKYTDTLLPGEPILSFVSIPIRIPLRDLELTLNQKLSETLAEKSAKSRDKDIKFMIVQNGPASLHGKGSVLRLAIPLSFKTGGKVKTSGKVTIAADISLAIREDWTPQVGIKSQIYWIKKPYVKFGPFKIRVAGKLGDKLQDALDKAATDLRSKAAHSIDLKNKAQDAWVKLYEPHPLKRNPPIWLSVEPVSLYMAPIVSDADAINLALGMTVRFKTSVGAQPAPVEPKPLPPLISGLPEQRGLLIRLPVLIDYAGLAMQLKSHLIGKPIHLEQGTVVPTDFEVYTSGPKLVVGVAFEGNAAGWLLHTRGTVYLTGEPVFDPQTHVLSVRDFQFTRQVDNLLVHTATWVLQDSLRSQLQRRMAWDLSSYIDKAKTDSANFLNRPLGKDFSSSGSIESLNISDLRLQEEGIVVELEARGQVTVNVRLPVETQTVH